MIVNSFVNAIVTIAAGTGITFCTLRLYGKTNNKNKLLILLSFIITLIMYSVHAFVYCPVGGSIPAGYCKWFNGIN